MNPTGWACALRKRWPSAIDRFNANIDRVTESGCWIWLGGIIKPGKRGQERPRFEACGRPISAHRFAYEHFVGPIPAGLCVCHRCDVPLCVNPSHLFVGTHQENMDDMLRKGRARRGGKKRAMTSMNAA